MQIAAPQLIITDRYEAFRRNVRQALDTWVERDPKAVRAWIRACKQKRDGANPHGLFADGEGYSKGVIPKPVFKALCLPRWATLRMYGKPFGMGNGDWRFDDRYREIFWEEAKPGVISDYRGTPAVT